MSTEKTRTAFNRHAVWAIYKFEMARALRTLLETREDRRGVRYELEILEDD